MQTPNELVDVLANDFTVIRSVEKQVAHREGLLHPIVIGELIDSQGNWTLVCQAADRQDAGQFVSPVGGHIRSQEDPVVALRREAFEEIGLTDFSYHFVDQAVYNREVIGRKENHLFKVYKIFSDEKPILNHESVSFRTFSPKELRTLLHDSPELFGEAFHFVVDRFFNDLLV